MQTRQCRMTCKGLLTYLGVGVIVVHTSLKALSLTSWFCILEILISIYRKYLHYFERLCSHGMTMKTWRHETGSGRVFSGSGIWPKYRAEIGKNDKYLDGIRDLTARREAVLAKIWARDARFLRLFVGNSGNRHDPNKRPTSQSRWCVLSNPSVSG